ncbi:putative TPR domain-containing protein [Neospora caninum Liverpool]|uniref:Putative TPR domain-containing protein n=1 Tax=Neospora caninum (strain Liverpool) TaxID=572307 RepID=F0VHP5_NEOCL|nr:putative TPR domain-containing protein [Neospora caninum Liverpool]CBZ53256.1 putative TPR domain-containing protein [Neospora caninum Liverpool]CEL67242.1 TPA: TPR domain-containing protein, putative [Neospora caninum Liverpool]|eukprot:XP_003883288.1 putative TPR domain-containing protein [Neospora caninum Liverpool]
MGSVTEKGETRSSEKAFRFARRFLDDEKERKKLQGEIDGRREDGRNAENAAADSSNDRSNEATRKSSPLQVMSNTDYGKYERLSKRLDEEEERKKKQEEAEAAAAREMMPGCSHDHSKERQIYEKPTGEKIDAAERFRQEGNAAFREKNYGLAAVNYRKALLQFDYTFPDTDEEQERMDSVKLPCHLNLAACKLHQQDYDEVYIQCRLALEMDPKNVKAFYRRGLAHLQQDDFVKAKEDLMEALAQEPNSKEIRDALMLLREKIQRYQRRSALTFKAMLRGDASGPPGEPLSSPPTEPGSDDGKQGRRASAWSAKTEASELRAPGDDEAVSRQARLEDRSSPGEVGPETRNDARAGSAGAPGGEKGPPGRGNEGAGRRTQAPSPTQREIPKIEEVSDDEQPALCAAGEGPEDGTDRAQRGEPGPPRGRKRSYNEVVTKPLSEQTVEERQTAALAKGRELQQKLLVLLRQKQQELKTVLERDAPGEVSAGAGHRSSSPARSRRPSFASSCSASSASSAWEVFSKRACSDSDASLERKRSRRNARARQEASHTVSPYVIALLVAVSGLFSACIGLLVGLCLSSGQDARQATDQPERGGCTAEGCEGEISTAALSTGALQGVLSFLSDGGVVLAGLTAAACVGIALLLVFLDGSQEETDGQRERLGRRSGSVSRKVDSGRRARTGSFSGASAARPGEGESSGEDSDASSEDDALAATASERKGEKAELGRLTTLPVPRRRKLTAEYIEEVAGPQRDIGSFPDRKIGTLHSDPAFDAVLRQWCN